ncbi:MAG: hypothetical protein AB8H79_04125, partial [Myxococcota bacterium]
MSGSSAVAEDTAKDGPDFGGWTPTGRKTAGPDSDLIEVENPDGHKQTAIVYDKSWREHDLLTTNVELVQSFMEFPMVEGIACMSRAPSGEGLFQYESGSVLALIEVIRAYRDQRSVIGVKAAVEMVKSITSMLQEASENGPMQGIYSHGGLTPWRIALDADGNVQVLGYGLPQMDMVAVRENPKHKARDDSYRYCPPERLTSGFEDISTDMFSLVLIAFEMATGEHLLTGRSAELKKAVEMGEAQARLMANPGGLPSPIHEAFLHALAFDPIARYQEPHEFLNALLAAEAQVTLKGAGLAEVMEQVRKTTKRGKALMDVGTAGGPRRTLMDADRTTRTKSAAEARPVRGRKVGGKKDPSVEGGGRWGKVARSGQEDEEEETSTSARSVAGRPTRRRRGVSDSAADAEAPSRRTRRRGKGEEEEEEPAKPTRRSRLRASQATEEEDKPARARPSRLRRSRQDADDADEPASKPTRSRRSRSSASNDADTPEVKADAAEAEKPTRSRRSRAAKTDDDAEVSAKAEDKPTRSSRSRKPKADDDSDAKAEAKPTRSSRSRKPKADDDSDAKAEAKPTRSSRSRTPKADDDSDA